MARVELQGVEKTYPDGFRAVHELDLVVDDGEFVVLVGPSGCGKSTTLRMIAGLEELSAGTVSIGDRVVNELPGRDRDVAMVFQSYALYPHLDVRANLSFGLLRRRKHANVLERVASADARAAHRKEMAAIHARVDETARLLGIEALLARKPGALSGGQRQRVALGRAIVRDPAVYLFDEPLSNLDARLRLETRAELKSLHARVGATSIYVTHDQEEAMTLGDRLVVMKDGVVQQCAPPTEIYERPTNRFVAGFVGTPPMNFLPARRAGGGALELVGESASVQLPPALASALDADGATEVVLGLRPDRMAPVATGEGPGLPAEVVTVENLGDRWDVVCALPSGARVTSRVLPDPALARGVALRLCRELAGAHLFRPGETGARIG